MHFHSVKKTYKVYFVIWYSIMAIEIFPNSNQHGGIGKHGSPPCTTTAKFATKLQNSYLPEKSENQAVWKSDIQGIKEVTFIQISRRGKDALRCVETWICRNVEWGVPHGHVVGKNWRNNSRASDPSPTLDHQPRVPVPGR